MILRRTHPALSLTDKTPSLAYCAAAQNNNFWGIYAENILVKLIGFVVILFLLALLAPFATVPAGHRGVMTTFGNPSNEVLSEEIHFRIPIAQTLNLVNVSIQKGEGDGDAVY